MQYLETVQELLDDGTSLSNNLVLSWYELRTNLRVTCGKLATNLRLTCDLTRKISIQVVGEIVADGVQEDILSGICCREVQICFFVLGIIPQYVMDSLNCSMLI